MMNILRGINFLKNSILKSKRLCFSVSASQTSEPDSNFNASALNEENSCVVNVWNEWDPLEEIVVGLPGGEAVPLLMPEVKAVLCDSKIPFLAQNQRKKWIDIMDSNLYKKAMKEHKNFCDALKLEGVKVVHPEPLDFLFEYTTPNFSAHGVDAMMPRDFLLAYGNELIESPMMWRTRYYEFLCYRELIKSYWRSGAKWTAGPKPCYPDELYKQDFVVSEDNDDYFQAKYNMTTEEEPIFDAADCLKAGKDLFVLYSLTTNYSGIDWLRRHLKPNGIRVHTMNSVDSKPMHFDTNLLPIRPGLFISNPERPCLQKEHIVKAGWDVVDIPSSDIPKDFPYYISSQWLNMNVIMLDEKRVIVEKDEVSIAKAFTKLGLTTIPIPFKHCFTFGGSFHCWTSDIRRKGQLQDYFNWSEEYLESYEDSLKINL